MSKPGPNPAETGSEAEWPEDAIRHRLIADWHFYQRRGGHRTSTDDLVVAWYACHRFRGRPASYLDLGCGIGSVLFMVSHRLKPTQATGIEAQAQSILLARRSCRELPGHSIDIRLQEQDLREFSSADSFDLITGSPPYFGLTEGVLPNDPQRRSCRFEVRGGVEDYLRTASKNLAPQGVFSLVFPTRMQDRVHAAASEHGLFLHGQVDFWMRSDRSDPFISVFDFRREAATEVHRSTCAVRDSEGEIHPDYQELRRDLGI